MRREPPPIQRLKTRGPSSTPIPQAQTFPEQGGSFPSDTSTFPVQHGDLIVSEPPEIRPPSDKKAKDGLGPVLPKADHP